jgi:uncharacterized membrane protein YccF (DUF307 family)
MSIIKYTFSVESLLTKEEILSKINNIEKESSFAMWFGDRSVYDISSTGDEFSIKQKPFYECFGKRGSGIKEIYGIIHPLAGKSKIDLRLDYPNWGSIFILIAIIWCLVFSIISDKANLMAALVTVVLMSLFPLSFFTYKKFFYKLFRKSDLVYKENKIKKDRLFQGKGIMLKKFNTILMIIFGIALIIFGPQLQIGYEQSHHHSAGLPFRLFGGFYLIWGIYRLAKSEENKN